MKKNSIQFFNIDSGPIINSPLEGTVTIPSDSYNNLILLSNYSLYLNLIVAYLIAYGLFIFTVRYVVNSESLKNKIENSQSLPNLLKRFLIKSINGWTYTSNFWIYLVLIGSFVFILFSALFMYGCLHILT